MQSQIVSCDGGKLLKLRNTRTKDFSSADMWLVIMSTVTAALIVVLMISWWKRKASLNINGKFVLVTGCDSGLGRETAIKLNKMGVHVMATCLTKEGEQRLKSAMSDKLITFQMDVTDSQQIEEVFQKVKKLLDGKSGKQNSFIQLMMCRLYIQLDPVLQ